MCECDNPKASSEFVCSPGTEVRYKSGDNWWPMRPNMGLGDTAARAIICHGCPERVGRNCGLSEAAVQLHIDGKPCPRDLFPLADGRCNFIGTQTEGAPKLLRWYARLTGYHFDTHLNDCGCFVPLKLGWSRVLSLFKGTSA